MSEMSHEELMDSQRRLSGEMGIAWRDCSTVIALSAEHPQHHPMPAWINPYDARIIEDPETLRRWRRQGKTPTTMYQQRINVLALRLLGKTWDDLTMPEDWAAFRAAKAPATQQLREDLRVFLTGFTDSQGNYWCGHCYSRCQFVDIGHQLDYPALWVSHTAQGYDAWRHTAQYAGIVAVEDGLRLAQKVQAERPVERKVAPKVYTLGYGQPGASQRVETWMGEPSTLLIDTRMMPRTRYTAWDGDTLAQRWGKRYRQAGRYLGNVNYKGGPILIADPETGLAGLIHYLQEGHDLVLLCGCKTYAQCHRHVIVDLLRHAHPDVTIVPERVEDEYPQLAEVLA